MSFHSDLIQSFSNFKEVFIDPLDDGKQDKLTAGEHIQIKTTYRYVDITSDCSIVTDSSALVSPGTEDIYYICQDNGDVYTWDLTSSDFVKSTTLSASFVAAKPSTGAEDTLYVLSGDNSVWSCTVVPNTILADYSTEINSLNSANSTQNSQISSLTSENSTQASELNSLSTLGSSHTSELTSLSQSLSEVASIAASLSSSDIASQLESLSAENSTQTSRITSLSTSTSELSSEYTVLASEVADKQDALTAGAGIAIVNGVISASAGISLTVVSSLPTTDISTTTIYLVPRSTSGTNDYYDEYVYVNNAWEHIGGATVDLTNYYNKTQIDSMFTSQSAVDSAQTSRITSLSQSASELASTASSLSTSVSTHASQLLSLSTENSTQTSELSSLSTAASELASENVEIASELEEKQPMLTAGDNIVIDSNNRISATGGSGGGGAGEWEILLPSSN